LLRVAIIRVILRLDDLIQYRSVTDTHTHTHTDRRTFIHSFIIRLLDMACQNAGHTQHNKQ